MGPSSSQPHSGFEQKFVSVSCLLSMYHPFSHSFNRPELLEHASKFYGVKFRNKVILFVISVSLLDYIDISFSSGITCGLRNKGGGLRFR